MALEIFLELKDPEIKGESQKEGAKDWIEILGYGFGSNRPSSVMMGSGSGAGRITMGDFTISKMVDKASQKLALANWQGEHIKEGKLVIREATGKKSEPYLTYDFKQIMITSYNVSGSDGSDKPQEQITFSYAEMKMEYKEQDDKGTLKAGTPTGWNVKEGKKI